MAFLEYMLLALLGTVGTASPETPTRALAADAVTQPGGGTEGVLGQATGGSRGKQAGTGKKGHSAQKATGGLTRVVRAGNQGRHARVTIAGFKAAGSGSTVSSSTGRKGGVKPNPNGPSKLAGKGPRRVSGSGGWGSSVIFGGDASNSNAKLPRTVWNAANKNSK